MAMGRRLRAFPAVPRRSGNVDLIEDGSTTASAGAYGTALAPVDETCGTSDVSRISLVGMPVGVEMEGQYFPACTPMKAILGAVLSFSSAHAVGATCKCPGTALAPPLWGAHSNNVGAGMARINTAAIVLSLPHADRSGAAIPAQQAFASRLNQHATPPDFPAIALLAARRQARDADYHVLARPSHTPGHDRNPM